MQEGFHYKDGLYVRRNKDHSVTIKQMKRNHVDETEALFEVTIDENGWASIIASVSKDGEGDGRFYKALEWHNGTPEKYQKRVDDWLQVCFGEKISKDKVERNHRFLEEALELVQSLDCTKSEAHQLVDYVFDRAKGEPHQECGCVMVTLAALSSANALDMDECGEVELKRVWTKVEQIREKQNNKPKHSPEPQ
jgi:hypothetical protein